MLAGFEKTPGRALTGGYGRFAVRREAVIIDGYNQHYGNAGCRCGDGE
jgi:hypothetical protein